ncbi:MAG: FISUMP domain-containing protein, partial [Paludibacter sp.]|nr:FISUMP domain-containing protein [Paludibacter sp.]
FLGSTDGYVNQTIYASPTGSQSLTFMLTQVVEVYNPATGKTWMDRNLGASRVATSIMDYQAYGDLYQWGRGTYGHEKRDSPITSTLSIGDTPGHGSFIKIYDYIYDINDWRSSRNSNLWQGVIGTNNPCPDGFRIPTIAEWDAEISYWSSRDYYGAFGSPLRLPAAGTRDHISGGVFIDSYGYYWSSTVYGSHRSQFLRFFAQSAYASYFIYRANGYSVRCIKD